MPPPALRWPVTPTFRGLRRTSVPSREMASEHVIAALYGYREAPKPTRFLVKVWSHAQGFTL